jgi:hypothetical protein
MVTIQGQPTAYALMDTLFQSFLLAMPTTRAVLARVGRVDRHILPTSICCFVGHEGGELRPCGILNTLRQTMIMHHLIDGQIFNGNHVEAIDDLAALLMGKISTSMSNRVVP